MVSMNSVSIPRTRTVDHRKPCNMPASAVDKIGMRHGPIHHEKVCIEAAAVSGGHTSGTETGCQQVPMRGSAKIPGWEQYSAPEHGTDGHSQFSETSTTTT